MSYNSSFVASHQPKADGALRRGLDAKVKFSPRQQRLDATFDSAKADQTVASIKTVYLQQGLRKLSFYH